jgi:hypothetical protein
MASPSHGENRGSSPLGSANNFNDLSNKAIATVQFLSNFGHGSGATVGAGWRSTAALCQPSRGDGPFQGSSSFAGQTPTVLRLRSGQQGLV